VGSATRPAGGAAARRDGGRSGGARPVPRSQQQRAGARQPEVRKRFRPPITPPVPDGGRSGRRNSPASGSAPCNRNAAPLRRSLRPSRAQPPVGPWVFSILNRRPRRIAKRHWPRKAEGTKGIRGETCLCGSLRASVQSGPTRAPDSPRCLQAAKDRKVSAAGETSSSAALGALLFQVRNTKGIQRDGSLIS